MSADLSAAYWTGAEDGRLVLQRCDDCGRIRHYPRLLCDQCYSFEWSPFEASLDGTVHSWTITHHVFDATVAPDVPYTLVTVDMHDGVRVLGRLADGVELRPGLPVRLTFERTADERPGPRFVARAETPT